MDKAPCLHCERRHIGCHSQCGDYAAAKAAHEEAEKARRQKQAGWEANVVLRNGALRQMRGLKKQYGGKKV